jgi:hypothetical protein
MTPETEGELLLQCRLAFQALSEAMACLDNLIDGHADWAGCLTPKGVGVLRGLRAHLLPQVAAALFVSEEEYEHFAAAAKDLARSARNN